MLILCGVVSLLFACQYANMREARKDRFGDYIDRDLKLSREDYKENLLPKREEKKPEAEPAIPKISDILTAPRPPSFGTDKLVTLAVTEEVPIKDVLVELGRMADVDMELDPGISGGIIFRVKDRPFKEVIERVTELGGLRYRSEKGMLRIERDLPYIHNYPVDFLNLVRSSTGGVNINTQVLGGGSSSTGGEGLSGGSNNAITTSYEGDLWASVETTVQSILTFSPNSLSVETGASSVPVDTGTSFSINKQAGVISVLANQRQQNNIAQYLESVRKQVSAQVLIEAKIVEVTLDEAHRTGIDWGTLEDSPLGLKITGSFKGDIASTGNFLSIGGVDNITSAVTMTQAFGVSRTLSSPRLHAMNNQQAVLTFAENKVYFTLEVQEETDGEGADKKETLTIESTLNTVPIGVILTLQPSINLEAQEVTMNIRPTLSRITSSVTDPGVDIIVARSDSDIDVTSEIPVIEVRELDSVMKIRSGEIMVIGGLMKETNINDDKGVPGVSNLPLFGNLFKSTVKTNEVVETIIFIQATIIDENTGVSKEDKKVYDTFMKRDPRPLAF